MDGPTDPTKEEVSHDAGRASFAGDLEPAWNDAVKLGTAKGEDEMSANMPTRCSLCSVALGPASAKCGQPVEMRVEHGKIRFGHCIVCEDTSLLLAEGRGGEARLLILEATFLDERVSVDSARARGHVHLDELVERAESMRNEAILLHHFSARYTAAEIEAVLDARLPPALRERVVALRGAH